MVFDIRLYLDLSGYFFQNSCHLELHIYAEGCGYTKHWMWDWTETETGNVPGTTRLAVHCEANAEAPNTIQVASQVALVVLYKSYVMDVAYYHQSFHKAHSKMSLSLQ